MKRIEKLRKCLKSLIKKNHEILKDFNIDSFIDANFCQSEDGSNIYNLINKNINDPGSIDGLEEINVTHEDLFTKLTSNCIAPTKEDYELALKISQEPVLPWNDTVDVQPKSNSKKKSGTKSVNKIVVKL